MLTWVNYYLSLYRCASVAVIDDGVTNILLTGLVSNGVIAQNGWPPLRIKGVDHTESVPVILKIVELECVISHKRRRVTIKSVMANKITSFITIYSHRVHNI